ncbi:GH92 family glycosyl hydrolase [Aestuariibacter sp. A3R04]|uniref:GH92 family glycosyl hydrolase n=1 Tax=Aestuariibacter sp. A3R04 TaxID=2841571 RepID=UPI001C08D24B|nr:GH92 family glycosyl hydrolase [Aestuariibacter sp. A3R04]MBU3020526.1 GH92 family glycosyl hydrolase [Aestuariibacter sp. A3R04]
MKQIWAGALLLVVLSGCEHTPEDASHPLAKEEDVISYVDPFIGTDGKGKTFPGATVPYGMVQLSPDNGRTGWDWIAGYFYPDNIIAGFSHTHLSGTGAGDLYDISFMPLTKPYIRVETEGGPDNGTIVSHFSHEQESASPGYYRVTLQDYNIDVALTAGLRSGFQRYRFPETANEGYVRVNLGYSRNWDSTLDTQLTVEDDYTISGYRKSTGWATDQRVYFYTRFSQPIASYILENGSQSINGPTATGKQVLLEAAFNLSKSRVITARTAISSVSVENAKANLKSEGNDKTFDMVRAEAESAWREELSRVHVEASEETKTQFYTAMYHAALAPRVYSDANKQYKGPDGNIHTTAAEYRYDFFSLWDTFRALHPWKTLVSPSQNEEMMKTLLEHYDVFGRLPVWIFQGNETDMMMGYHSVPVLVDAYLKNRDGLPGDIILNAAIESATQTAFGLDDYQRLGYVPYEYGGWNVSLTMEYAYDDWAIAQLAKSLGKQDIYETYLLRSQNYRHHFDAQTGFMRAKSHQGDFREPFNPDAYHPEDYCEANAWQYTFFVPHDVHGLIRLMGGETSFAEKLDAMFNAQQDESDFPEWISGTIGQYVHGNEPSHHVPYLYQFVGQSHKTQQIVRQVMRDLYHTNPDGLAGNEDAGQMSAWYLFSALGFYPVDPVAGEYVLGSPAVVSADMQLENGKVFSIRTKNQSDENVYVSNVTLNGQPLNGFILTHDDVMAGGVLEFTMSDQP